MTNPNVLDELNSSEARANLFPQYLMKLLNDEVSPISLWWLPDGMAFAINPDKIAEEVLDKHFQKTKYSSFIRRLHNEGFRRQTRKYKKVDGLSLAEGTVVLSHDLFQRDKPELLDNFYKKGEEQSPKASALQQAKAESKMAAPALQLSPNALTQLRAPAPAPKALTSASAVPRLPPTDLGPALPSGLLGNLGATTGLAGLSDSSLSKSLAALRAARSLDLGSVDAASLLAGRVTPPSQKDTAAATATSAFAAPAPATSPQTNSNAAALFLDSQIRLQQLMWEQSRRELEQQTNRLSAMEALRLRAAAYGWH